MAFPKKPNHLKVLTGSRQPKNENTVDLPLVDEVPKAPFWLPNQHAVDEFNKLATMLHANKLLTEGGVSALGHLCALHGKLVEIWESGECPTGHMLAQYRNLVNDFALPPVAQGKIKSGKSDDKPGNKFANNGQRKTG